MIGVKRERVSAPYIPCLFIDISPRDHSVCALVICTLLTSDSVHNWTYIELLMNAYETSGSYTVLVLW